MRKRLVHRALAVVGALAVGVVGLSMGSSPAGADTAASWNYPVANCVAESIGFAAGTIFGYSGGQSPAVGSDSRTVRGFCPAAGYTKGQVVDLTDSSVAIGDPRRGVNLNDPSVIDPAAPPAGTKVYALPTYAGPPTEALPGPAHLANGVPENADRTTQWSQYVYDLQMVYNRVLQDLGNPAWNPANPWPYWNAHESAAKATATIDQTNWAYSQFVPTELHADIVRTCYWWSGCYDPRWNGLAHLRNTPPPPDPLHPQDNWFWMNNWWWGGGSINGNISGTWAGPPLAYGPIGTGGAIAGCTHSDTGVATGAANETWTHQTWQATSAFGCGIAVGDGQQNAAILLSGLSVDVKVEWVGGQTGT